MVYVMMSRCCALDQLHIVDKFDPEKITVDGDVKTEVTRMDKVLVTTIDLMSTTKMERMLMTNLDKTDNIAQYSGAPAWHREGEGS